ncbi:uncharacterized protein LOC117289428 [Asterias rubens]|uniref:uncharacterized protein LOC117289428 n=1 Tax=Asterias rubens TaxID=7604 RepID=UPI001455544A|nr:uncharacterized protein LOC117289428 [Asterias rubens]
MADTNQPRVMLWAVYRSCSTATMRALSTIEGGKYFYEPYTAAAYFGPERVFPRVNSVPDKATSDLPGSDLAYDNQVNTFSWVKQTLEEEHEGARLVFVKDHAYSLKIAGKGWDEIPNGYRHTFLIRNPNKTIPSWRKLNLEFKPSSGTMDEEQMEAWQDLQMGSLAGGFHSLLEHYEYVRENLDPNPFVMDADDLLADPEAMIPAYCQATGTPFRKKMVEWGEDNGVPAQARWIICRPNLASFQLHCKQKAITAACFSKEVESEIKSIPSPKVAALIQRCMPFYEKLYQQRHVLE